jgi:GNAT superfamily N-acetyltransferase
MEDVETAVALMNEYSRHYLGVDEAPLDVIRTEWSSPGFDPQSDVRLVFTSDHELVGYVETWTNHNPPVHPWVWWCVLPEHTGKGIGSYLLTWAEARASKAIPRCPEDARVAFRSGAHDVIEPARLVMEDHGMIKIRSNSR